MFSLDIAGSHWPQDLSSKTSCRPNKSFDKDRPYIRNVVLHMRKEVPFFFTLKMLFLKEC
jgi:hypothetical protein